MQSKNGTKKRKTSNTSEKLVRDKCTKCKKLFLAFRAIKSRDLKTCDECLPSKSTQNQNKERIKKTENTNLNPKVHAHRLPDVSVVKPRQNVDSSSDSENLVVKNNFKNAACQLPHRFGSFTVRDKVIAEDFYFCTGDIVSLHSEGTNYYAQISVLIENEFCEKRAALIWLLPTTSRTDPSLGFDPFAFTYGPQDESLYDVKLLKFVMHPPNSFFKRFIPRVPQNKNIVLGIKHKYKSNSKRKN